MNKPRAFPLALLVAVWCLAAPDLQAHLADLRRHQQIRLPQVPLHRPKRRRVPATQRPRFARETLAHLAARLGRLEDLDGNGLARCDLHRIVDLGGCPRPEGARQRRSTTSGTP